MIKQAKVKDPKQSSFIGKLLATRGATMFFICEKSNVTIIKIIETPKIVNLLNGSDNENSKFATKEWYVVDSESKCNYPDHDPIKFLTKSIKSSLCNYSDAYILDTGNITLLQELLPFPLALLLILNLKENNHLLQLHN